MIKPEHRFSLSEDIVLLKEKAVFIKSLSALVLADLHIGIEYSAALKGVFLPTFQYEEIKSMLDELMLQVRPKRLIIVGDFKHEFAKKTVQELSETADMLEHITSYGVDFVIVRGNHDNFLRGFLDKFGVDFVEPYLQLGKYVFVHGHLEIRPEEFEAENIVMGHEHPSILFADEVGGRAKVPAFLYGKVKGKTLLVLPAFSPLAPGVEVNAIDPSELLSPLLRAADIDSFLAFPILDSGILPPAKIAELRLLAQRF